MQQIPGYIQKPCTKCNANVFIAQATGTGYCTACQTMNSIPMGAVPPNSPAAGFQAAASMGTGFPVGKLVGIIAGALVIGIGSVGFAMVKTSLFGSGGKGHIGYSQLSIDPKKADPDAMISAVHGLATKWKSDAVWLGVNYQYVNADGTMDLSKGGATVEYLSPGAAKNLAKSVYQDSVKRFDFSGTDVNYSATRGVVDPKSWADFKALPTPGCSIKQLVQTLVKTKGLTPGKTVRVTYDIQFQQFAPNEPSWRVMSDDPKIDNYFSMSNCSQTK